MSSPARTLGPFPTASRAVNAKKRVLTDSEDTEERDLKRVRPQDVVGDQSKRLDKKDKKKRRKKKRKMPLVQSINSSDAEGPVPAPGPNTLVRSRSRTLSAGPSEAVKPYSTNILEPDTRAGPSAGPPAALVARVPSPPREDPNTINSTNVPTIDKGKGRATEEDEGTHGEQEATQLRVEVSAKADTISQHENLVSALQQSLSCQICLDLMHRPFALSPCGHSACHQCLINWFKAPPADVPANQVPPAWLRTKTCPHCRSVVKERPIEIWAIKDMVANLVKSGLAQGFYSSASEANEGDPWAGVFPPVRNRNQNLFPDERYPVPIQHLMGLRDDEDGVYRCIECHHELWDGICSQCGRVYQGHHPDPDTDDYDDDTELWRDEAMHAWGDEDDMHPEEIAFIRHLVDAHPQYPRINHIGGDYDDLDWDAGGDTEIESDNDDAFLHGPPAAARRNQPVARAHIEEVEEDERSGSEDGYESSFIDDGDHVPPIPGPQRLHDLGEDPIELSEGSEAESDLSVHVVRAPRQRPAAVGGGRGTVVISDDEDEGGDNPDDFDRSDRDYLDEDEDDNYAAEVAAREHDLYGDDGSISRVDRRHDSHESGSEEEPDEYY